MSTYQPGDIVLVRDYSGGSDLLGNLILAGNRARYGNCDASRWTHSALIVSENGDLVEALAQGIERTNISKYAAVEKVVIDTKASDEQRKLIVEYAEGQVGVAYDKLDFISLAFSLLTGLPWSLHQYRPLICSGECSRGTEKCIPFYPYPPEAMLPSDLAFFWHANSGDPLPPLSFFGRALDLLKTVAWALSPFTKGIKP